MNLHNLDFLKTFKVIGIVMLILACSTAIVLYCSFGHSTIEKVVYGGIGLVFALLSALLLPASVYIIRLNHVFFGVVCFIGWVVMAYLGMNTHLGFMSVAQNDLEQANAIESMSTQAAKSNVDNAAAKVEKYASFAAIDVSALQTQKTALNGKLTALQTKLRRCKPKHYQNCIDPLTAEIMPIENQLLLIDEKLNGNATYHAALSQKNTALVDMKKAMSTGNNAIETIHPLFVSQAAWLGGDVRFLQARFLAISAIAFELATAFIWTLVSLLEGSIKREQVSNYTQQVKVLDDTAKQSLPSNEQPKKELLTTTTPIAIPTTSYSFKPLQFKQNP